MGITAFQKDLDICKEGGVACPITAGDRELVFSFALPSNTPEVTADVKAIAFNPDKSEIACARNKSFKISAS